MIPPAAWWVLLIAGAAATLLSAAAFATLSAPWSGRQRGSAWSRLADEPEQGWFAVWTLGVIGPVAFAIGLAGIVAPTVETMGIWPPLLVGAAATAGLVAGYVLVIVLASRSADTTARLVALPLDTVRRGLLPAWALFSRLRLPSGPTWLPARLRDEALRVLVQADEEDEPIEDEEMEMIAGIIELGDTRVREVMVPRIDIVAMPIDATLDEALDTIISAGHSRIPVYRESIDDIAGLLYAKDLLKVFRARDLSPDLPSLLRDAFFVPQSKPVDELLQELQTRKTHMAIVVDEYGGTAGLVTIEDLLEEIVGEIQDEYDQEEPRIEAVSDSEVVCNAGMDIDDINRLMDIDLPTERVDTLAGLVFTELGKVPEPGDLAHFDDADIEVLELDGRRIHRVRVVRTTPASVSDEQRPAAEVLEAPARE